MDRGHPHRSQLNGSDSAHRSMTTVDLTDPPPERLQPREVGQTRPRLPQPQLRLRHLRRSSPARQRQPQLNLDTRQRHPPPNGILPHRQHPPLTNYPQPARGRLFPQPSGSPAEDPKHHPGGHPRPYQKSEKAALVPVSITPRSAPQLRVHPRQRTVSVRRHSVHHRHPVVPGPPGDHPETDRVQLHRPPLAIPI